MFHYNLPPDPRGMILNNPLLAFIIVFAFFTFQFVIIFRKKGKPNDAK